MRATSRLPRRSFLFFFWNSLFPALVIWHHLGTNRKCPPCKIKQTNKQKTDRPMRRHGNKNLITNKKKKNKKTNHEQHRKQETILLMTAAPPRFALLLAVV